MWHSNAGGNVITLQLQGLNCMQGKTCQESNLVLNKHLSCLHGQGLLDASDVVKEKSVQDGNGLSRDTPLHALSAGSAERSQGTDMGLYLKAY